MADKKLLIDMIKGFYPYAKKQLGFNKPSKIFLVSDEENASKPFGKTAYYDPDKYSVFAYITGRHPKDILRSISHELVHHTQNCAGKMQNVGDTFEGYAQKDKHLRELEREAYEKGNMIFRDYEDTKKSEEGQEVMKESKEDKKESANDHYIDRAEKVYKELIERWKLVPKKEENKNGEQKKQK